MSVKGPISPDGPLFDRYKSLEISLSRQRLVLLTIVILKKPRKKNIFFVSDQEYVLDVVLLKHFCALLSGESRGRS